LDVDASPAVYGFVPLDCFGEDLVIAASGFVSASRFGCFSSLFFFFDPINGIFGLVNFFSINYKKIKFPVDRPYLNKLADYKRSPETDRQKKHNYILTI
jgi:hypothetical protein